jgi:hypothetical protein
LLVTLSATPEAADRPPSVFNRTHGATPGFATEVHRTISALAEQLATGKTRACGLFCELDGGHRHLPNAKTGGWYVLPIIVVSFRKFRGKKPAALRPVNA